MPLAVMQMSRVLSETQKLIQMNQTSISESITHIANFTKNLESYHKDIDITLKRINSATRNMDSVNLSLSMMRLDSILLSMNDLLGGINQGNGTLGKLVKSDSLHNALLNSTLQVNKVLLDLKKYPEKYIPVPFTKKQRRKAKTSSLQDSTIWN